MAMRKTLRDSQYGLDPRASATVQRFEALRGAAWDCWIFGSVHQARVYLEPSSENDDAFVARFGLRLAPSPTGLRLMHAGHEDEKT